MVKGLALLVLFLVYSISLTGQQHPRSSRDEAVSLAIAGDYRQAYEIFRNLLREAPEDALLNYYTGAACVRMDRIAEGMEYLEKSVRHNARFPQAYQELGEAYLKKKIHSQASEIVEKGLALFPRNQALQKLQARIKLRDKPE